MAFSIRLTDEERALAESYAKIPWRRRLKERFLKK